MLPRYTVVIAPDEKFLAWVKGAPTVLPAWTKPLGINIPYWYNADLVKPLKASLDPLINPSAISSVVNILFIGGVYAVLPTALGKVKPSAASITFLLGKAFTASSYES